MHRVRQLYPGTATGRSVVLLVNRTGRQTQALTPAMVPTADPDLRAGKRIDASIGLSVYQGDGRFEGNHLSIEYAAPVYQSLDGPQLETDRLINFAWQYVY